MFMLMTPSNFINRSLWGASGGVGIIIITVYVLKATANRCVRWSASCVVELWNDDVISINIHFHIEIWRSKLYYTNMGFNYRLITAYLLLRVNLDKIMHARWDFYASSARTRRVSALDKHQNWRASALFCLNSRAQSKYAVVNLIHTRRKQTFLSFIMWWIRHFSKLNSHLNITNNILLPV